uniref:Uncharacterized protein n=1 Tax=Meloidogyne enterolobii TaxID=390850 RepID=A0A6V7XLE9_MELEN|nr:unnamed protein product [Meloidogyne enterolobii]
MCLPLLLINKKYLQMEKKRKEDWMESCWDWQETCDKEAKIGIFLGRILV